MEILPLEKGNSSASSLLTIIETQQLSIGIDYSNILLQVVNPKLIILKTLPNVLHIFVNNKLEELWKFSKTIICFEVFSNELYLSTQDGEIHVISISSFQELKKSSSQQSKKRKIDQISSSSFKFLPPKLIKKDLEKPLTIKTGLYFLEKCSSIGIFCASKLLPTDLISLDKGNILQRFPSEMNSFSVTCILFYFPSFKIEFLPLVPDNSKLNEEHNRLNVSLYKVLFGQNNLILEQPILLQGDSSGNVWWIPLLLKEPAKKLTNIQEPVHKIYLVKSLNSSLIDFIIIIGSRGKLTIISSQKDDKIEKEYQLCTYNIITCLCWGDLLIFVDKSVHICKFEVGTKLPVSLFTHPCPLQNDVYKIVSLSPYSTEIKNPIFAAITLSGRFFVFHLNLETLLAKPRILVSQMKVKTLLEILGNISEKQKFIQDLQSKYNENLKDLNYALHLANVSNKKNISVTIKPIINSQTIPPTLLLRSTVHNNTPFTISTNWSYGFTIFPENSSQTNSFSVPLQAIPKGSSWTVDIPFQYPISKSILVYAFLSYNTQKPEPNTQIIGLCHQTFDMLDLCSLTGENISKQIKPKLNELKYAHQVFHSHQKDVNIFRNSATVQKFRFTSCFLEKLEFSLEDFISQSSSNFSKNNFFGATPSGDTFSIQVKPIASGKFIFEMNYQIDSELQFFLRSALFRRLVNISSSTFKQDQDYSSLSSYFDSKIMDSLLQMFLPLKQQTFKFLERLEEIKRKRETYDSSHFGNVYQMIAQINQIYVELKQIFQSFRLQLDSSFVY